LKVARWVLGDDGRKSKSIFSLRTYESPSDARTWQGGMVHKGRSSRYSEGWLNLCSWDALDWHADAELITFGFGSEVGGRWAAFSSIVDWKKLSFIATVIARYDCSNIFDLIFAARWRLRRLME